MSRGWRLWQVGPVVALLAACTLPVNQSFNTNSAAQAPARGAAQAPVAALPPADGSSVRFAVLGDTGTGDRAQYEVARALVASHDVFPFEFAIMVGDNMYGSERPQDYARKFEIPYKPLLEADVQFYASLGNHDDPNQRFYKPFNMNGDRFYSFKKDKVGNPGVRFFALDSNYMTREQIAWLERELKASQDPWKIAFFHHPLYSSGGRHGSEVDLRDQLEPLFLAHGVTVVFAGHEHFYERLKPQKGVSYFTAGGSAKLRAGDIRKTELTAVGYDRDNTFMLVEIADQVMRFQTITRTGQRIDEGAIALPARSAATN